MKTHVFYIMKSDMTLTKQGKKVRVKDEITQKDIDASKMLFQLLKRDIEAMSDGRLSVTFEYTKHDGTIPAINSDLYPETHLLPDEVQLEFCRYAPITDLMWTMWAGRGSAIYAFGGTAASSCLPYQLYIPTRNFVTYPIHRSTADELRTYMHEFFHSIEGYLGISPSHGFGSDKRKNFPGWKGNTEIDYYYWHFQNTLPGNTLKKNGYENLSRSERNPFLMDDALLQENLKAVQGLSMENRKKAEELANQARGYLDKGNNNMALSTAKQALKLNPSQPTGLSVSGFAEKNLGRPQNAVKHFIRYNQLRRDRWAYR